MFKNKMKMFKFYTGLIAERVHFSRICNSQWCLTIIKRWTNGQNTAI